jgi:hypothetical protein
MSNDKIIRQAEIISRELMPVISKALGGKPAMVQGAVLADLTAIWLAGHVVRDDPAATASLREDLLSAHVDGIRSLVDYYDGRRR